MFDQPVVYVDIETSGSGVERSKIIEIAAIRIEHGKVVQELKSLINPGESISYWITKLTGITDTQLTDAPYFEDIARELYDILDGALFIAHHVRFDYSFIKRQLESCGYTFRPSLFCTVRLSRALYSEHKGHSLEKIITRHNIPVTARHRAYDDALAIKHFTELAYKEHGQELFNAAKARQLKLRSLPPNLDEKYLHKINNKTGVYVFEDEQGQPIYIGKSVNMRSRVLSHFNQDTKVGKEMKLSKGVHKLRTIETGSELEALLLESQMVKDLLPIYNRKLRRVKSHLVLVKNTNDDGYTTIQVQDKDLAQFSDMSLIYGVYGNRSKAKSALEEQRKTFGLCPKLLGLEKTNDACFQYQLGKCKGACTGKEAVATYNVRVEIALQRSKLESWPYQSAVVIKGPEGKSVVVDQWVVVGYFIEEDQAEPYFKNVEKSFDVDTYRILRSYLKTHMKSLTIMPINLKELGI